LRHTLRRIASSAAYARSANAIEENQDDDRFYSHALRERLEPAVLADAISDVLGVYEQYGAEVLGQRAITLIDPKTPSLTLDVLGRCGRETSCESESPVSGLPQKLHLFNGELLNGRIGAEAGRLEKLLAAGSSAEAIVKAFYRVALCRPPSDNEWKYWSQKLESVETPAGQREFLQDFVWGMLPSQDFVTNH